MANYNSSSINSVEIVTLMADITLPTYDKTLNRSLINKILDGKQSYYRTKDTEYKDMIGRFSIPIETPTLNTDKENSNDKAAPKSNNGGNALNTSKYSTTNIVKLKIPKYLVMQFEKKIPKGTKFFIACLGGNIDVTKMRIISLYDESVSQLKDELEEASNTILGGAK